MSEDAPNPALPPPSAVTVEELFAYFKAKEINPECKRCPHTSWHVLDSEETRGAVMQTLTGDGAMTSAWLLPVIPLICKNCGDVWLLARTGYEDWLRENRLNA